LTCDLWLVVRSHVGQDDRAGGAHPAGGESRGGVHNLVASLQQVIRPCAVSESSSSIVCMHAQYTASVLLLGCNDRTLVTELLALYD